MPGRYPTVLAPLHRKSTVKGRLEAVGGKHPQVHFMKVTDRRQDNLGGEGERGDHGPRCDRAVVGAIGSPARNVIEETSFNPLYSALGRTGPVARRQSPAM